MIHAARRNFPQLRFEVCDAARMQFGDEFDAVFSNAALHWVTDQKRAITCIARSLKPSGRFVFEMGGHGNLREILTALYQALRELEIEDADKLCPWTFPSIGNYAQLLESQGLEVELAVLFDRPTPLESGDQGLEGLRHDERIQVIHRVEELARPKLFRGGSWVADYKRLRMVSVKA
jgi:trans-aconitate 2-methyltransferase